MKSNGKAKAHSKTTARHPERGEGSRRAEILRRFAARNDDTHRTVSESKTVLVRDLMKSVFLFGFRDQPIEFVTELGPALDKLSAGENFYVYPGGDTLYCVDLRFYQSCGIPRADVLQRLSALFPPPPEAVGL
jgi:hypothetical protein